MMTATGVAVVLFGLVLMLTRTGWIRPLGLIVSVAFGMTLTMTPVGPALTETLSEAGASVWAQVEGL
jgi:hypothetical protein